MTFCIAPFVNVCIDPSGVSKPCCLYKGFNEIQDPIEAFNSKEWNSLRERMLLNETIDECGTCNNPSTSVGFFKDNFTSYRDWFNHRYKFDGISSIKSIELSRSNKCNFKCIICGWDRSSRWYEDEKNLLRLGTPIASDARIMPKSISEKIISVNVDDIDFSKVDNLVLHGGEPLLDEKIYEIFEQLPDGSHMMLSTNCSISPARIPFHKFDKIDVSISIDGINEIGTDVRLGFNTKHFTKILNEWMKYDNCEIRGHYVYHNMNAFSMQETQDFFMIRKDFKWMFDILKYPKYLSPRILPDYIKLPIEIRKRKYDEAECKNFIKFVDYMKTKQDFHFETLKIYDILKSKIKM